MGEGRQGASGPCVCADRIWELSAVTCAPLDCFLLPHPKGWGWGAGERADGPFLGHMPALGQGWSQLQPVSPALERGGGGPVVREAKEPRRPPPANAQGNRPEAPLVPPSGGELVVGPTPTVRVPALQRPAKAISVPRLMEVGATSLAVPNAEATSATSADWASGGGSGVLTVVV